MAKHKTIEYECDKCGVSMNSVFRELTFTRDISNLWKPETWGKKSKNSYDLCENCFDSFSHWFYKKGKE